MTPAVPARACALALAALATAPAVAPAAPAPYRTARAAASPEAALQRSVVRELNRVRRVAGLRRLRASAKLAAVAERHSDDQAGTGAITHTGPGGDTSPQRIRRAAPATSTGEVIGFLGQGETDRAAQRVVRLWLGSPAHRAIILGARYRTIGVGSATGTVGGAHGLLVTADLAGR